MRLGYFKKFGSVDFEKIKELAGQEQIELQLVPLSQEESLTAIQDGQADLVVTSIRDSKIDEKLISRNELERCSLVAVLQVENFDKNEQTVELAELHAIPDMLVATVSEEQAELHYHRDLLAISSPLIAVESFNEAALMASSGSGYFLMNERTAKLLVNDQLQKLFLLNNGVQLKEDYSLLTAKNESSRQLIRVEQIIQDYFKE
ncbi:MULTISPECIES: hypothetical protein [Lactobacillus]|uniref:LysR substrate-binding domain-containing protein n=1 Tax=Lactobacillus xujianguonis TaxID=2495899 RepID=A0A437SY67_9LACO|nr:MULTISPECIES: hypothetical protein [Lactobacillus]RVU71757.1 hypothetical protein EJK17_00315 [Lactobacillus xujianguonis]RVU77587.1 hypothetical protein EJK20_01150 [Lactobacillus xujianguonis]